MSLLTCTGSTLPAGTDCAGARLAPVMSTRVQRSCSLGSSRQPAAASTSAAQARPAARTRTRDAELVEEQARVHRAAVAVQAVPRDLVHARGERTRERAHAAPARVHHGERGAVGGRRVAREAEAR